MKIFFLFLFVLSVEMLSINFAFASEININNDRPSPPVPITTAEPYRLIDKISEGITILKKSPPLTYETKVIRYKSGKIIKTDELLKKQIALAILDTATGEIFEKRVWVKEEEIKNFRKTGIVTLTAVEPNELLDIQPRQWNSFNTFYGIVSRSDLVVVANKYLLESRYLENLPERAKTKFSEIIYVPYSTALHQPEIIAAGKNYLERIINLAYEDLNTKNAVKDPVNKDFVRNIILIEHIDPDLFNLAVDGGQGLSERVLAIIGANLGHAYRYTGSPAGASGLAQFIKPTYQTIVRNYSAAGLVKDYSLGMADHVNAVKAMVLFFDAHRREIEKKINRREIVKNLGITEEMLAATYNGGPTRVIKSLNKFGLAWISQQFDLPKAKRIFRKETLDYILKFRSIKELEVF